MRARAGALALLVVVAGCSLSERGGEERRSGTPISVTPLDGSGELPPELPILVGAAGGTLTHVAVQAAGRPVEGVFSADRSQWRSARPMTPGTSYSVEATATGPDGPGSRTVRFSTKPAAKTFAVTTLVPNKEDTGLTVGVGMPIILTFDKPVTDRVSVERNLFVQASKPVDGAWHWLDAKNVVFRPRHYWPPYTKVRVTARLAGIRGGDGMYGKQDYTRDFKIGRSQISVADTQTHHMKIELDGRQIKDMPISAGSGDVFRHHTTSGIHVAMSREDVTVMTSPDAGPGQAGYYETTVYNSVRISNTGEYVHGAPWSVGDQGNSNVSHGCVNVSPENAKWFKNNTLVGDPIVVTGTPRRLDADNGWSYWQDDWPAWLKRSRLRAALSDPL
ncbi:L,D-transpeptidase [Microbispora sp. H10670]|uniref:L,D-transpeptidase n=1 Tax=unclassified Microbispora TaxID=2614687 RepID=UPI001602C8FC|nr:MULTISPECIES: Ig-like domain-containing protein [unclassified Microbispora]